MSRRPETEIGWSKPTSRMLSTSASYAPLVDRNKRLADLDLVDVDLKDLVVMLAAISHTESYNADGAEQEADRANAHR